MNSPVDRVCECESQSERLRIKCLANSFKILRKQRLQPLSDKQYEQLCDSNSLSEMNLLLLDKPTATEQLAEEQILLTFFKEYAKCHPKFVQDGPTLSDLTLKSTFYQSIWDGNNRHINKNPTLLLLFINSNCFLWRVFCVVAKGTTVGITFSTKQFTYLDAVLLSSWPHWILSSLPPRNL